MTYTTPIIENSVKAKLSDFFYSYEEMSLFGLDCYYRLNGQMIKNHYTPTLSALYLEFNKELTHSNDSTLDDSYLSYSSDDGIIKGKTFLHFTEDKKHYNRKNFISKIDEIFASNDIEDTTLNQIGENSWYVIEWTPGKNTGSELSTKNSFLVFYKIRNEKLSESVKHIPVIGCLMNQSDNDGFWFTNHVNINNIADFNVNRQFYSILMVCVF
jgi:hypothetical protein